MKRKLRGFAAILGVTVMIVLSAGCGETAEKETKEIVTDEKTADAKEEMEASSALTEEDTDDTASADVTIEEQVLVEQDGLTITAQEYVTDSFLGDAVSYTHLRAHET